MLQEKLYSTIDKYVRDNSFPRTLLLEGEYGCGKHTLSRYIAKKLNIEFIDITESLDNETLQEIALKALPMLYFIDGTKITVKEQNVILKFLEEPLRNSYIILICEDRSKLLETVINRCRVLSFAQYTKEDLREFLTSDNELILEYANTPGRVIEFEKEDIKDMLNFIDKMLTRIGKANYSNVLTIPNKIKFKEEDEGLYNKTTFFYLLYLRAVELYAENSIPFFTLELLSDFNKELSIPRINEKYLLETLIIKLKQAWEGVA